MLQRNARLGGKSGDGVRRGGCLEGLLVGGPARAERAVEGLGVALEVEGGERRADRVAINSQLGRR